MNRRFLAMVGLILLAGLVFWAGTAFGQTGGTVMGWPAGTMMGAGSYDGSPGSMMNGQVGMGMMNGQVGMGMMNGQYGMGMMNGQYGMGMQGMGAMMSGGMMGGMMAGSGLANVDPLSIGEAEAAVEGYLASLEQDNLALGEIMIFDNHAYAQIMDRETGLGAFEVLVDPVTGNVYPEPGPNMMWNTTYGAAAGMMAGMGMQGMGMQGMGMQGMMGSAGIAPEAEDGVTAGEAVVIARRYLDAILPGTTAGEEVTTFPGTYTLHVERDGQIIGMLSVNATTGQVFLHHWHGDFIEMAGEEHG